MPGCWLGHPDIDAVSCLYSPARAKRVKGKSVLLGRNTWSPINSQNTAIARDAGWMNVVNKPGRGWECVYCLRSCIWAKLCARLLQGEQVLEREYWVKDHLNCWMCIDEVPSKGVSA